MVQSALIKIDVQCVFPSTKEEKEDGTLVELKENRFFAAKTV